ncbi:hypothetical protein L7F22_027456 [Adiantum nelumboides]|nr:hypothetical protein [Adiantum nelumboides]
MISFAFLPVVQTLCLTRAMESYVWPAWVEGKAKLSVDLMPEVAFLERSGLMCVFSVCGASVLRDVCEALVVSQKLDLFAHVGFGIRLLCFVFILKLRDVGAICLDATSVVLVMCGSMNWTVCLPCSAFALVMCGSVKEVLGADVPSSGFRVSTVPYSALLLAIMCRGAASYPVSCWFGARLKWLQWCRKCLFLG